jgi:hypothetical protein
VLYQFLMKLVLSSLILLDRGKQIKMKWKRRSIDDQRYSEVGGGALGLVKLLLYGILKEQPVLSVCPSANLSGCQSLHPWATTIFKIRSIQL